MKAIQRKGNDYPVIQDNFIHDIVERHLNSEPKRENNFLSNIFSKRVTNNFIRIRVYSHCTFYLSKEEED